jgi:hypothetical protein
MLVAAGWACGQAVAPSPAKAAETAPPQVASGIATGTAGGAEAKAAEPAAKAVDPDDVRSLEQVETEEAAVARPVDPDPVQLYGWKEHIHLDKIKDRMVAKLDTGARTSSLHAEDVELFERDGRKWVRFLACDPAAERPVRTRLEAPLVRIAKIKEPGGQSVAREVVRLAFRIGERKLSGEFTLNNRKNMLAPVLIGRSVIKELGWVDCGRVFLAEQKLMR